MTYNVGATKTGPLNTNGVQANYGFTFKIYDKTDIEAVYATAAGVESIIAQAAYTILTADLGKDNGGTVTITNPAASTPAGGTITFRLNPPKSQATNLRNQGSYKPEEVERMADRIEMQLLSMAEELSRAVKVSISSGVLPSDYLTLVINNATAAAASATSANNSAIAAAAAVTTINAAIATVTYLWGGTSGGTANAQTITTNPAPVLAAGQKYRFLSNFTNTAAAVTLAVNGQAAKNILKDNGSNPIAQLAYGDILQNGIIEVEYDGTQFQYLNCYAFGETITPVVAAATLDLSNTPGDFVSVSGSTGITAVTMSRGQKRTVRFTGTPTITNGASLALPGGVSLAITAGDVLAFRNIAGVVYVENYQPYVNPKSPTFDSPTATTQAIADNSTKLATTAYADRNKLDVSLFANFAGSPYTVVNEDIIYVDASAGAVVINLPSPSAGNSGRRPRIVKTDVTLNVVTIQSTSPSFSTTLNTQNEEILINSTSFSWFVVDRKIPCVWTAYTPTATTATGALTNVAHSGLWRREGDSARIRTQAAFSGAGGTWGNFYHSFPTGIVLETSAAKLLSTIGQQVFGTAWMIDGGVQTYLGVVAYDTTGRVQLFVSNAGATYVTSATSTLSGTVPFAYGAGDTIQCEFLIPVVGWNA